MEKRYMDACHLKEATDELLEYFSEYVDSTPEIKHVKIERDRLCTEL
jgi:hypothetical protein